MGLGVCFVDCGFFDLYVLTGVCWFWLGVWFSCFGVVGCGALVSGAAVLPATVLLF